MTSTGLHAAIGKEFAMNKLCAAFFIVVLLSAYPVFGGLKPAADQTGIYEMLGQYVPLDISFTDENGAPVSLRELIKTPVVLSLIYYDCRGTCPALIAGLTETLDAVDLSPGGDFYLLTISFDENDTHSIAMERKRNYTAPMKKKIPDRAWRFLTGDRENIGRLADAVGFRFKKTQNGFLHPVSLIVLSPEGKIVRYLYGTNFLPRDLSMAVYEASQGRTGRSVGKLLLYCFSYDPQGKRYVFNILKVVGSATIIFLVSFLVYLNVSNKAYQKKRMNNGG